MTNNKTILVTGGKGSFWKHPTLPFLKKYNTKKKIIINKKN